MKLKYVVFPVLIFWSVSALSQDQITPDDRYGFFSTGATYQMWRVQGINDFAMFATMAVASLSAGALLDSVGWVWTNLAALALLALVVVALLRVRGKGVEPTAVP